MKTIFGFLFIFIFSLASLVFADGYLDVSGVGSKVPMETISPKVGKSQMVTLTGNAFQYVDVTAMKKILVQGVTSAGVGTPIEIYFYNTASATDIADPFYIPAAVGPMEFGIGAGVTRVYFRNFSTASPPSGAKFSVLGR